MSQEKGRKVLSRERSTWAKALKKSSARMKRTLLPARRAAQPHAWDHQRVPSARWADEEDVFMTCQEFQGEDGVQKAAVQGHLNRPVGVPHASYLAKASLLGVKLRVAALTPCTSPSPRL